ncbi:SirB2 family protein [Aquabacterium sp.]|uniref:SirB2 family protein n=1 Tax=Aquabacterium sp. TaxID=1872578 RepID=UPI0024877E2F|nr:SirB2 family protein [Aquabacterium sp.]MDI1260694.1 SirB2 family protein [Aquabacterium sp.]
MIKTVHQTAVVLSITGFFVRGLASLLSAGWVRGRLAKTLPHLIDSVLLVAALWLAWTLRITPGNAPWLLAKLAGLLVYIALGVVALRPGRSVAVRAGAWVAALGVFGWIVSVAITKNPFGFLAWS